MQFKGRLIAFISEKSALLKCASVGGECSSGRPSNIHTEQVSSYQLGERHLGVGQHLNLAVRPQTAVLHSASFLTNETSIHYHRGKRKTEAQTPL